MSDPIIQNTRVTVDPSLSDLLAQHKKDIFLSFNCHAIATVQSFDKDKQTITATINYKKTYFERDATGKYIPVLVAYPILVDTPTMFLGGGKTFLTFPVAKGDECLILFNDRDLDNWFKSGQVSGVASTRMHSFSDGIALVGLRSAPNVLTNFDATHAVLGNGTTGVGVGPHKVKIFNNSTTLNALLQQLISDIQSIMTIPAVIGVPLTLSPGSIAALAADASAIAGLLE